MSPQDNGPKPVELTILDRVADELDAAASQYPEGATAPSTLSTIVGAPCRFFSKLVYTAGYGVSYGLVFPALLLARVVPKENSLIQGMSDGAHDATAMAAQSAGNVRAMLGVSDDPYRVQGAEPPALTAGV